MLLRKYLTSTCFHWDLFCGWCLFKAFKLCYSPAILKVLFIFWINVTNLWLALYSANRKSHRGRAVTLIKSTFCPLIDHALCFMSRISLLICRLQKCSPTFYYTAVRVFPFYVWSLLVWLLYTWEVRIKGCFFSFPIWIFIIMKTLLPTLNGHLNL